MSLMLNLTSHVITLRTPQGDVVFPPSGIVARVETTENPIGTLIVNGHQVPVVTRQTGAVTDLPNDGTPRLVSSMVLAALPAGTPDVYAPDTGPSAIRNEDGQIVAITRLVAAFKE